MHSGLVDMKWSMECIAHDIRRVSAWHYLGDPKGPRRGLLAAWRPGEARAKSSSALLSRPPRALRAANRLVISSSLGAATVVAATAASAVRRAALARCMAAAARLFLPTTLAADLSKAMFNAAPGCGLV